MGTVTLNLTEPAAELLVQLVEHARRLSQEQHHVSWMDDLMEVQGVPSFPRLDGGFSFGGGFAGEAIVVADLPLMILCGNAERIIQASNQAIDEQPEETRHSPSCDYAGYRSLVESCQPAVDLHDALRPLFERFAPESLAKRNAQLAPANANADFDTFG